MRFIKLLCISFIVITSIPKLTPQQIYIANKYDQELKKSNIHEIEKIEFAGNIDKLNSVNWGFQWLEIKPYVINYPISNLDNFNKDIESVRKVLDANQDLLKIR